MAEDWPLALMDYRSIKESEIHPTSIFKQRFERQGQTVSINHCSDQQWYFLNRQDSHEVTLIKIWDNKDAVAKMCPHGSFHNPQAAADAKARESVEVTKPTGKPFTVRWWAMDFLILPPKYLFALRDAGWVHLSFFRTISDLTPLLEAEIQFALQVELEGRDGQKRNARNLFSAITHRTASRILIGKELCRQERFFRLSTSFIMSIFFTALVIVKLPLGPLRRWLA
ncbi:hypothetical protein Daus18300_012038 [Diaporthe australafricana]|uniref:Uncharacterized protein n=1 Tax=Diaporthe australafricana TaxID=127596 RepID=A0ABR3W461_9PEZI